MKNITVTDCKRKLTLDDISRLERELEVILPSDYKEFLLKHNGGHPVEDCFSPEDNYASSSINYFYTYAVEDRYTDIVGEYSLFKDRIPVDFIPIADDPGGNLICLGVGKNFGKVYFWDHEEEADGDFGEEPSFNNMYLLANSFTNFINMLYKFDLESDENDDYIYTYTHEKYSLPTSEETKKYGVIVTDFFAAAPAEVENYMIVQKEYDEDRFLYYDVKSCDTRFCRRINADGSFEDFTCILSDEKIREAGYKKRKVSVTIYDKHAMLHSQEIRNTGVIALDFFAAAPDEVKHYVMVTNINDSIKIFRYDVESCNTRFCRMINEDGSFEDFTCALLDEKKESNDEVCVITIDTYSRNLLLNSLEAKEYGHNFTDFIKEAASEVEFFWMEKREPGGLWLSYEHEASNTRYSRWVRKNGKVSDGSSRIFSNGRYW